MRYTEKTKEQILKLKEKLRAEIKNTKLTRKMFERLIDKIVNDKKSFKNYDRFTIVTNGGYIQYNLETLIVTEPIIILKGGKVTLDKQELPVNKKRKNNA